MDGLSPQVPGAQSRPPALGPHKPFVDSILMEDRRSWRKQLRTAMRIYGRLLEETGCGGGCGTAKNYARRRRAGLAVAGGAFLELAWAPARLAPASAASRCA